MRLLSLFVTVFALFLGLSAQASQCYCKADPYSKKYTEPNGVENHWWGGKRDWTCEYTCSTPNGEAKIVARHKKTYFGKDDGLWGICDGLIYESRYNTYLNDFVYTLEGNKGLDPVKSASPDLQKFTKDFCQ